MSKERNFGKLGIKEKYDKVKDKLEKKKRDFKKIEKRIRVLNKKRKEKWSKKHLVFQRLKYLLYNKKTENEEIIQLTNTIDKWDGEIGDNYEQYKKLKEKKERLKEEIEILINILIQLFKERDYPLGEIEKDFFMPSYIMSFIRIRERKTLEGGKFLSKTFYLEGKDNFMEIRIHSPSSEKWESIIKRGKYYYKTTKEKGHRFITLDIGDLEEEGIQGIAFIRGVPKTMGYKIGEKIAWDDFRSQAIRVEFDAVGINPLDSSKERIRKVMKEYRNTIKVFLERETSKKIDSIKIKPKEPKDYRLLIEH
jgi:hypothetical protein